MEEDRQFDDVLLRLRSSREGREETEKDGDTQDIEKSIQARYQDSIELTREIKTRVQDRLGNSHETLARVKGRLGLSKEAMAQVRADFNSVAKPIRGLGTFEDILCTIGGIRRTADFSLSNKAVVVFCSDNGVTAEGVSQSDKSVTLKVTEALGKRISTVCVMAERAGAFVIPVDVGVDSENTPQGVISMKVRRGTRNFLKVPAMTVDETVKAFLTGIEMAGVLEAEGYDIIAAGDMGIGNTTTATAVICAFTGAKPEDITGEGAGLPPGGLEKKIEVIKKGLELHGLSGGEGKERPLSALAQVGGYDIAALAGLYTGGALYGIPVVLDGLISMAALLAAEYITPGVKAHVIPSHRGREKGAGLVLDELGLKAVINADMALGESTGAVMLFPLLDMAYDVYARGSSFEEEGISPYVDYKK